MTKEEFYNKVRECINEENFTPPHDLSFDTESVLSFLDKYYINSTKKTYLYSDALARTCKITKSQAMHICCELRDEGLVDEYSDLYCSSCFHTFESTLDQEEMKGYMEDFECDACGGREGYVGLSYVFKVTMEDENLDRIKKDNEKYIQDEISTFLQDTEKAINEGYDITKDPMWKIKIPDNIKEEWEEKKVRLEEIMKEMNDPDNCWNEIERLEKIIEERDREIVKLKEELTRKKEVK